MNARPILVWSLLAALAAPAHAEGVTLGSAVETALRRSPGVQDAAYRLDEAEASVREARLGRLPSLTANSVFTRGNNPVYAFGALLDQKAFTQADFDVGRLNDPGLLSNFKSSLELAVPLFTGFEAQTRERLSRLGRDASASAQDSAVQGTRYAVVESFLQALLQRGLARGLADRIRDSEAEVEEARKLKERGLVLGSDYYAAQAMLEGLKAWQVQVNARSEAARSKLATLMGAPQAPEPAGSFLPKGYPLEPPAGLVQRALRDRPELRRSGLMEGMTAAASRQAALSLLPRVEGFAALETDTRDFNANPWNRLFGVRASIPLGDPAYLPRRAKAAAAVDASRAATERVQEAITIEVSQTYQEYKGAADALPIAKAAADRALQSLKLFRPLYREGRQSILDVLRAEEGLARAEAAYLESIYGVHAGRARLFLAVGGLDEAAVAELERGLEGI